MHEQERQARNLETEATKLLAEAAGMANEPHVDEVKMARLVKEAVTLKDRAVEIREAAGLPPRDIVAEYVEFFSKHGLPLSGGPN